MGWRRRIKGAPMFLRDHDPRTKAGAYITDGKSLREVISYERNGDLVTLDSKTMVRWRIPAIRALIGWRLVKAAPQVPDCLPGDQPPQEVQV